MTFRQSVEISGPASEVRTAVSTVSGLRGWWSPIVTGSMSPGHEFAVGFEGLEETIGLTTLEGPDVTWRVRFHTGDPSWDGSTIRFVVQPTEAGTELTVHHDGVDRFRVQPGWERFLGSIRRLVEHGRGRPYRVEPTALDVALAYHEAWTSGEYDSAVSMLAEDLRTEVPINVYEDRAEWAQALTGFGDMVRRADLVTSLGDSQEAILIYDMEVSGLGILRVAENFTVSDGRITRIRHVHDTHEMRQSA